MTTYQEDYFVVVCTGCYWEIEGGNKNKIMSVGSNYGIDFHGNITLCDFRELVKFKTGMIGKEDVSLHYEHPEMHYVIKMVDESDFTRLKRVIKNVTNVVYVYPLEYEDVQEARRFGEGSASKRSSGKGSNNPEGNQISSSVPLCQNAMYSHNAPKYSTIPENLVHKTPINHNALPENFVYVGNDNVETCDEPRPVSSNDCTEVLGKVPFLDDAKLAPLGNPTEDWYASSDDEKDDYEKEGEEPSYTESYTANHFFGMPKVPKCPGPVSGGNPVGHRLSLSQTIKKDQIFENKHELQRVLGLHAIYEGKQFRIDRSTKDRYSAKCIKEDCNWYLTAKVIKHTSYFQIRKYNNTHTCSSTQLNPNHRQARKRVLGTLVAQVMSQNLTKRYSGSDLVTHINLLYKIQITYPQAWREKKYAMEILRGTHEESFIKLPIYCYNLEKHNPGTRTFIKTDDEERFQFVFVAIGASLRSFQRCCRRVLVVDGSHLKGDYTGMMLLAVAMNGNNQIVPVAFAICQSESNDNWSVFMEYLYSSIGDVGDLSFVSDRNQGIVNAIATVFPNAHHGICGHHIHGNVVSKFGKSDTTAALFWEACKAYTIRQFSQIYDALKSHHPAAWNYIDRIDPKRWSRAHFPGRRYSHMTSNIAESVNSLTTEARRLPILMLMDFYRSIIQQWYFQRRNVGDEMTTTLTTWADKKIAVRDGKCANWKVSPISNEIFEVTGNSRMSKVNFHRRSCTCRKWQLSGLPCGHVIVVLRTQNYSDCSAYAQAYYATQYYRATYEELIHPLPTQDEWEIPDGLMAVQIPVMQAPHPGRTKNKDRFPSQGEDPIKRKCSRCKQPGHNRGTCMAPIPRYEHPTNTVGASGSGTQNSAVYPTYHLG